MLAIPALIYAGTVLQASAVYLAPALIALSWIWAEIRAARRPRLFTWTVEERRELVELYTQLRAIGDRLEEVESRGTHLKKNSDGSFHRGSKLGVELNKELDELLPAQSVLDGRKELIETMPSDRFHAWAPAVATRSGLRVAAACYLPAYLVASPAYPAAPLAFAFCALAFLIVRSLRKASLYRRARKHGLEAMSGPSSESSSEQAGPATDDREASRKDAAPSAVDEAAAWHEVLGIAPSATRDEIQVAWRAKMTRNHPDKVSHLDPEFIALAEARSRRLTEARDMGLRQASG